MREVMTKSMARNIFYGGSLFFILIFLALSAHSHWYIVNSENSAKLDESVVRGKHVWEKHACINCHSILGEGAYFAPEVGNVMTRWGVLDDPESAFETLKGWMEAQPTRHSRSSADAQFQPQRRRNPRSGELPDLDGQYRRPGLAAQRGRLRRETEQ